MVKIKNKTKKYSTPKEETATRQTRQKLTENYFGKNMEIRINSKTFIGIVTDILWMGSQFLELNDGEALINTHKIEYAIRIGEEGK